MNLTQDQQKGLEMVKRLVAAPKTRVAVLAGFAGTGKTTLLRAIAETVGTPIVITPTGKAAARVKEAAGIAATTVHRWMYKAKEKMGGGLSFERLPPDSLNKGECGLIVVEEASMLGRDVWEDIYDNAVILGMKVLLIGDPFQLPPVEDRGESSFSVLDPNAGIAHEYVLMTEVLRQAQESLVIRASMAIRGGDMMAAQTILPRVKPSDFIEAGARIQSKGGVVICYRNDTRHWANVSIRETRRLPVADLAADEPILVLKNNYPLGVFNGETHRFKSWRVAPMGIHTVFDRWQKTREETRFGVGNFATEDGAEFGAVVAVEEFFGRLKSSMVAIATTAEIVHPQLPVLNANFGYTMTAHKAQGSEWDDVLVAWEPSLKFWGEFKDASLRWLYTAVTRSKTTCSVCFGIRAPPPKV